MSDGASGDGIAALCAASEAGDPAAMCELGRLLAERGEGEAAEGWFRRAVDLGDPQAMLRLGRRLRDREELDAALALFEAAAEAGMAAAGSEVGWILGTRGDADGARRSFERAGEGGDTWAMRRLGRLCSDAKDGASAIRWYERAAAAGDAEGALSAGWERGWSGEWAAAERLFRQGMAADEAEASLGLGLIEQERGNLEAAGELIARACPAEGGRDRWFHGLAMVERALVLRGLGDHGGYADWMGRAAAGGDARARTFIASDSVVGGEWEDAEERLAPLVAADEPWATWLLGFCADARGDDAAAQSLFREAMERGYDAPLDRTRVVLRRIWLAARYVPPLVVGLLAGVVALDLLGAAVATVIALVALVGIWFALARASERRSRGAQSASFMTGIGGRLVMVGACGLPLLGIAPALAIYVALVVPLIVVGHLAVGSAYRRIDPSELPPGARAILDANPDVDLRRMPPAAALLGGAPAVAAPRGRVLLADEVLARPPARLVNTLAHEVGHVRLGVVSYMVVTVVARFVAVVGGVAIAAWLGLLGWHGVVSGASAAGAFLTVVAGALAVDVVVDPLRLVYARRVELRTQRLAVEITPDPRFALLQLRYGGGQRREGRLYHLVSSLHPSRDEHIRLAREIEEAQGATRDCTVDG